MYAMDSIRRYILRTDSLDHCQLLEAEVAGCEWFLPEGSLPGPGAGDEEQKENRAKLRAISEYLYRCTCTLEHAGVTKA